MKASKVSCRETLTCPFKFINRPRINVFMEQCRLPSMCRCYMSPSFVVLTVAQLPPVRAIAASYLHVTLEMDHLGPIAVPGQYVAHR